MSHWIAGFLLSAAAAVSASAQTYTIATAAGGGLPNGIPGTGAALGDSRQFALDPKGNMWITLPGHHTVLRWDAATGIVTQFAGNGTYGSTGDLGPAVSAQLQSPDPIAVDSAGNVYVAENLSRIRKISDGVITTIVVGSGINILPGRGDGGLALNSQVGTVLSMTTDAAGNLYLLEVSDYQGIRKISPNGIITTVAGGGGSLDDNIPATSAKLSASFSSVAGMAVDAAGNIYYADTITNRVRMIAASTGMITTVAGSGVRGFSGDGGPAIAARLAEPGGVAVDGSGNLYIVDQSNLRIRMVSADGVITTIAGGGSSQDENVDAASALVQPLSIAVDPASGNILIAELGRIRRISKGMINTILGGGGMLGDGGAALAGQLFLNSNYPNATALAVDSSDNLYLSDRSNQRIRKVTVDATIDTAVGGGSSVDENVPALSAYLSPNGVSLATDRNGNLYFADSNGNVVREVSGGIVKTIAGGGGGRAYGFGGDGGPVADAQLAGPGALAIDSASGAIYLGDSGNLRIRKILDGIITTAAGNGTSKSSGDGGPASQATFESLNSFAFDQATGNLYVADNCTVRKISPAGIITRAAGGYWCGDYGDGFPAIWAAMGSISAIAIDASGSLLIADADYSTVRKVSNGVISTILNYDVTGWGFSGDGGSSLKARHGAITGIAADSKNNVYVADSTNNRIRVLHPTGLSCGAASLDVSSSQIEAAGGRIAIAVQAGDTCPWAVQNLPDWISFAGSFAGLGSGSASVVLTIAPNWTGETRSAFVLIATSDVQITQFKPANCTYGLDPAGQGFSALKNAGYVTVNTQPGCIWAALTDSTWITLVDDMKNGRSGTGSFSYRITANEDAAPRIGVIRIGTLAFTIQQAPASIAGYVNTSSLAQVIFGGSWSEDILLSNHGTDPTSIRLAFYDGNGSPLQVPMLFSPSNPSPFQSAELYRTLNPGEQVDIQLPLGANPFSTEGWAQLQTLNTGGGGGAIDATATLFDTVGTKTAQAVVPFETRNASKYIIPWDTTQFATTGIAYANLSSQPISIPFLIHDSTGKVIYNAPIDLPAKGHESFGFPFPYSGTLFFRTTGTFEFDTPPGGQISVLAIQSNGDGTFTVLPVNTAK